MPPPVYEGQIGSDTYIFIGMTGCGKSMLTRLLADQQGQVRMVWILDSKGRDHYRGVLSKPAAAESAARDSSARLSGYYFYYGIKMRPEGSAAGHERAATAARPQSMSALCA